MGRYARQFSGDRRTAHFSVQLTPFERSELERQAKEASLSLADFVRLRCLSERPNATTPPRVSSDLTRHTLLELSRIGTNLNQLTRVANTVGDLPARAALDATLSQIVATTAKLITP